MDCQDDMDADIADSDFDAEEYDDSEDFDEEDPDMMAQVAAKQEDCDEDVEMVV